MARTNIDIEDNLLKEASKLTKIKTKRGIVETAIRLLISVKKRRSLLDLMGKVKFAKGYNYKSLRN